MAERFVKKSTLVGWADAIRAKKGTADPIAVSNFASEILSISTETEGTEGLVYTLSDDGTYYICSRNGVGSTATDIVIASSVDGIPVKEIGFEAFRYHTDITSVKIPSSVETIASYAFQNCTNKAFTDLVIPYGVKIIGSNAFNLCSYLKNLTLSSSIVSIGKKAFAYTSTYDFTVNYLGTVAQWNKIDLGDDWGTPSLGYVQCTDGKAFTGATITFTIDGTTYEAKYGMTWDDWVADTTLNTGGYVRNVLSGVEVAARMTSSTGGYGIAYEDAFVPIAEAIVSGRAYTEKPGIHTGGSD